MVPNPTEIDRSLRMPGIDTGAVQTGGCIEPQVGRQAVALDQVPRREGSNVGSKVVLGRAIPYWSSVSRWNASQAMRHSPGPPIGPVAANLKEECFQQADRFRKT